MKRLTVLRHAKSSWGDPDLDDFDRPLNDRGWEAARRIGRELQRRQVRFDLVLASPAVRVRETLDGVQERFAFEGPIHFDQRLYLAGEELLLTIVHELPDSAGSALLVGHNPGLQELVLKLAPEGEREHRRVQEKFPTAALAMTDLPALSWRDVETGSGWLAELILPRELD